MSEMLLEILKKRSNNGLEFAKKAIPTEKIECKKLSAALEYYISNWENFTHPGLFSIACEAVGGNPGKAVDVQAVMAMIAAALDIHDDIIDKSNIKHEKPTVLGKFGHDVALILGDVFFVTGFTLLGKSIAKLPGEKIREILATLRRSLLELGSVHALELGLKGRMNVAPEECMKILEMKAASVEADMRIGAIVGGGTNSEIEVLTRYGRILGILATLREEFIDVFEIQELRQRMKNECLPMPIQCALQGKNSTEVQRVLLKKEMTNKDVDKLLDIVFQTGQVKKLKRQMKILIEDALCLIAEIKNEDIKSLLSTLATATLEDL
jgi:geranylgeranyl pyrophosphate synthase